MAAPSKSTDAATHSGPSHLPTNVNTLGPLEGGVLEAEEDLDDKTDNKQEKAEMDAEDAFCLELRKINLKYQTEP